MHKCRTIIVFFLFGMIIVSACEKDKLKLCNSGCESSKPVECANIDISNMGITIFKESRFQFKSPFFNPKNAKEIIYIFIDNKLNKHQLILYNLVTHERSILTNSYKIYGQPKWNEEGYIAFGTLKNGYVSQIFIVKDNGDSLRKVTLNPANLRPFWDNSSNRLFWTHSPDLGSEWYLMSKDIDYNNNIDTISSEFGIGISDIYNNMILSAQNINGTVYFGYFNLNAPLVSNNFIKVVALKGALSAMCWDPLGKYFYISLSSGPDKGLYKVYLNGHSKKLLGYCDNKTYTKISCSKNGDYLVAERVKKYLEHDENDEPTGTIVKKSTIWLINTNTGKETKIKLQ